MALKKLDVRGAKCPIPIVKAKKEMDPMAPGDQLPLQMPGELPEGMDQASGPDRRTPLPPPERGPEITEIR